MSIPTGPVLLFTPGIDSLLAKYILKDKKPTLVYYALMSRYTKVEVEHMYDNGMLDLIIDTSFNFSSIEADDANIPHRNLHLGLHACSKYGDEVYINGTLSDRVSDNNPAIMKQLTELAKVSLNRDVTIKSPFPDNLYKCQLAQAYIQDGNDPINLVNTFSCYTPRKEKADLKYDINGTKVNVSTYECMRCNACFRKGVVLNAVGIYRSFNQSKITDHYEKSFLNCNDARAIATNQYIYRLRNGGKKKTD